MLELTDLLAALVEAAGARGVAGLRPALQQLCKAALDGLHARCLGKLTSERGAGAGLPAALVSLLCPAAAAHPGMAPLPPGRCLLLVGRCFMALRGPP